MPETLQETDWVRIHDALKYTARDLFDRSYTVHSSKRQLLWQESDDCNYLANKILKEHITAESKNNYFS